MTIVHEQRIAEREYNLNQQKKTSQRLCLVLFIVIQSRIICENNCNIDRMSARTLGQNLNVPEEVAQGYVDSFFAQFPVLQKFIEENSNYPIHHNGKICTELGDELYASAYRFLWKDDPLHPGKKKMDGRVVAKLNSAGINYKVQSYSSLALGSGFEGVIQQAAEDQKLIRNVIVVHK